MKHTILVLAILPIAEVETSYYLRLRVLDRQKLR